MQKVILQNSTFLAFYEIIHTKFLIHNHSQKFRMLNLKTSRIFGLAKISLVKVSPIKVTFAIKYTLT